MTADYKQAKEYVLGRLAGELSPHLTYHSLRHTASGVNGDGLLCLATAALFHDIGFLVAYDDHETSGIAHSAIRPPNWTTSPI